MLCASPGAQHFTPLLTESSQACGRGAVVIPILPTYIWGKLNYLPVVSHQVGDRLQVYAAVSAYRAQDQEAVEAGRESVGVTPRLIIVSLEVVIPQGFAVWWEEH